MIINILDYIGTAENRLPLALIFGILFHFIGDYILQNHWMAKNKVNKHFPAFIHALVYSIPFSFIVDYKMWLVIFITHFFIDRYRLAVYWIKFYNGNWKSNNYGYDDATPVWLSTWLLFIVDNTFHIIINTICIIISTI